MSIVGECGFPAATVHNTASLANWLKRSILTAETGIGVPEAVRAEAWRTGETLVQALYNPAVALCDNIVRLRARVLDRSGGGDPIQTLDSLSPQWRGELPFDLEDKDVRVLVEELVRARRAADSGLVAVRRLRRRDEQWASFVEIGVTGFLDDHKLPDELRNVASTWRRVRLRPAGALDGHGSPIVALERGAQEERTGWDLRPLVQGFEAELDFDEDVRLCAIAGGGPIGEFTAFAGDPLVAPVIVLRATTTADPSACAELEVVSISPGASRSPWLALAVDRSALPRLKFDGPTIDLGEAGSDGRRVIAFSGRAELEHFGERLTWRTGAEEDLEEKLVLTGRTVRGIREQVFQGSPSAWLVGTDLGAAVGSSELLWRSIGSRNWRTVQDAGPVGRVEFAVRLRGELRAWTQAAVVPAEFRIVPNRRARTLDLEGLAGGLVGARAQTVLPIVTNGDGAIVDLSQANAGSTVDVVLRWQSAVTLKLQDPFAEPLLLAPDGSVCTEPKLSVGRLGGYRLLSSKREVLCFELVRQNGPRLHSTRVIEGLTPLVAFSDTIRGMLGSTAELDARVRLSWLGRGQRVTEIALYDEQRALSLPSTDNAFGAIAELTRVVASGFSLASPAAGTAPEFAIGSVEDTRSRLRAAVGDGPWLILGRRNENLTIRPGVLTDDVDTHANESPLQAIVRMTSSESRSAALLDYLGAPEQVHWRDLRMLAETCVTADRSGTPFTATDTLRAVCAQPNVAPFVLAACETLDERRSVLKMQDEFPLLWPLTPIDAWEAAFQRQGASFIEKLAVAGLPGDLASGLVASALGQVVDLMPGVRVHAQTCFVFQCMGGSNDPALVRRICRTEERTVFDLVDDLVKKHADGAAPPTLGRLIASDTRGGRLRERFDPSFSGLIAAIHVGAQIAAGRREADGPTLEACRAAWLFDRDFFENGVKRVLQDSSS